MDEVTRYPRIRVEGSARERGFQYGEAARERVHRSIEGYREAFQHFAGWDWSKVHEETGRFRDPIRQFSPKYHDEILGIAEGAGVDELDILAINVRTEIMFAATARDAAAKAALPGECTSFAVLPRRAADGRLLLGENWDWLEHAGETVVVLEALQDDGPDFVTVVEAGLLAKLGFNSRGVALAVNALVSTDDRGESGVPFHVLLRGILDCETISDVFGVLQRGRRAASGNYLVGDQDGVAFDIEAAPGDYSRIFVGYPEDGVVIHANHYIHGGQDRDVSLVAMPDSVLRLVRLRETLGASDAPITVEAIVAALADHAGHPIGLCCHPDERLPPPERTRTLATAIMDVARRRMWLASGNPCTAPLELLDYGTLLGDPERLRSGEIEAAA